jgi:hypothetical protein
VLLASITVAVLSCTVLGIAGLLLPLMFGSHPVAGIDLLVGIEAQLTCASVGIAIGLLCSRLVIRRQGYALILALALVMILLLVPGLMPVNILFRLMGTVTQSMELVAPVSGFLAIAVVLLVISGTVTQFVASRRD